MLLLNANIKTENQKHRFQYYRNTAILHYLKHSAMKWIHPTDPCSVHSIDKLYAVKMREKRPLGTPVKTPRKIKIYRPSGTTPRKWRKPQSTKGLGKLCSSIFR